MSETKKLKRKVNGTVVRYSSPNTIKVRVEQKFAHSKYGKIVKTHKNYTAHIDEKEAKNVEVGSTVTIEESKPISKTKSWKYVKGE